MAIEHEITHFFQPTNVSCAQTAGAMLGSWLGRSETPEEMLTNVPVVSEAWGTLAPALATWFVRQGYDVAMYTGDFQILDLEWATLDRRGLVERMEAALDVRTVQSLGTGLTREFLRQYIEFVQAGGQLHIRPYLGAAVLNELLEHGPIFANVSPNVLFNYGRTRSTGLRTSQPDDLHGDINTHFVIVYGCDNDSNFLIADPMNQPGRHVVDPERMVLAMAGGQIQCENALFQPRHRQEQP